MKVRPSRQHVGNCDQYGGRWSNGPKSCPHPNSPIPTVKEKSMKMRVKMATSMIRMQNDDVDDEREKQNRNGPLLIVTTKHGKFSFPLFSFPLKLLES